MCLDVGKNLDANVNKVAGTRDVIETLSLTRPISKTFVMRIRQLQDQDCEIDAYFLNVLTVKH